MSLTALVCTPTAYGQTTRVVGSIVSIHGNAVRIKSDTGAEIGAMVDATTRLLRTAPGERDLKSATPVALSDLQPGDRVLIIANGTAGQLTASTIVVMRASDIAEKRERETDDWQKRGIGGLVSSVDVASGAIQISVPSFGGSEPVAIHTTQSTIFRRYAPESVKFDDAKPSSLDRLKAGDQLRARGARSADGRDFVAEEVVFGSFHNVAGTIVSADPAHGILIINDLQTKHRVTVKISPDSQMRKLPEPLANRIALRLKRPRNGEAADRPAENPAHATRGPAGHNFDLQQVLNRLPAVGLADLHTGDAIIMVTTEGGSDGRVTVLTLLSGVEPILSASPASNQPMLLSGWSLGGPAQGSGSE